MKLEPEPLEITWDAGSVEVVYDAYERRRVEQAELREMTARMVAPVIPVKALARRSGISQGTLRAFIEGRALNKANEAALRKALGEIA